MGVNKLDSNQNASWTTSAWNTSSWKEVPNPLQGTFLETPAPLYWCYFNNEKCFFNVSKYLTYDCPKNAVEASWTAAQWLGNKILLKTDSILNQGFKFIGLKNSAPLHLTGTSTYQNIADHGNELAKQATNWALEKNTTEQIPSNPGLQLEEPFNIVDLLGPALLMGVATNKALSNAKATLFSLYLLLSGKRTVTTTYRTTPQNWTMSANPQCSLMHTKPYSSKKLSCDIVMEGLFTAAWSTCAYFSFQGIEEALVRGGCEESRAHMLTKAILVTLTAAPNLYAFAKACIENEDRVEGPVATPHLAYTNPSDPTSIDIEPQEHIFRDSVRSNNPLGLLTNSGSGGLFNS